MAEDLAQPQPAKKYNDRYKALLLLRNEYEQDWQDIQAYVMPRKGLFMDNTGQSPEKKKDHTKIIDPEALMDLKDLAAAMLTGMTPKSRPG